MEEIISLIYHGCKLARDLESNLPNLANQPNTLSNSCDEIINIFINIKKQLLNINIAQDHPAAATSCTSIFPALPQQMMQPSQQIDAGVQEWLRSSYTHVMENILQSRAIAENSTFDDHMLGLLPRMSSSTIELRDLGGRDIIETGSARSRGSGEEFQHSVDALLDSGRSSSSQRPRRSRTNTADRTTVRVAAPRMGNTEIPPDDGFTWRKYGQKEILGSTFPRGYYRCTHQKLYQCPAKKQVQRLDDDPYTFEVTYRGDHTCILSSTAPSGGPAAPPDQIIQPTTTTTTTTTAAASVPLGTWLSMEFRPSGEGLNTFNMDTQMQVYRDFDQSGRMVGSSSTTGPSTVRFGGQAQAVDYHPQLPVVDMADAMFNSGSSSNNSMELIFSSNMEDK